MSLLAELYKYPSVPGTGFVAPSDLHPGDPGTPPLLGEYFVGLAKEGKLFDHIVDVNNNAINIIEQSEVLYAEQKRLTSLNEAADRANTQKVRRNNECLYRVTEGYFDVAANYGPAVIENGNYPVHNEDVNMPRKSAAKGRNAAAPKKSVACAQNEGDSGTSVHRENPIEDVIMVGERAGPANHQDPNSGKVVTGPGAHRQNQAQPGCIPFAVPDSISEVDTYAMMDDYITANPNFVQSTPANPFANPALWPELANIPISDPDEVRLRESMGGADAEEEQPISSFFADAIAGDPRFSTDEERYQIAMENTLMGPERIIEALVDHQPLGPVLAGGGTVHVDFAAPVEAPQPESPAPQESAAVGRRTRSQGRGRGGSARGGSSARGGRGGVKKGKGTQKKGKGRAVEQKPAEDEDSCPMDLEDD